MKENKKIVVCQFYTSDVLYGKYSEKINQKYCEDNGYDYYVEKDGDKIKNKIGSRAWTWYKPLLVEEVLNLYTDCEYVLFMDIDAIFCNNKRKIEEFITNDFSILMTEDHGPSMVNAGIMLIKNNQFSKDFMKNWWDICEEFPQYKQGLWHDQTCIGLLYERLITPQEFKIIDNFDFNSRVYSQHRFIFHAFSFGDFPYRTIDLVYKDIFNITTSARPRLSQIAKKFPTDKDFTHNYFETVYEKYFSSIRDNVRKFCEVGIGGFWGEVGWVPGNSLRIWEEYFPNAEILGLDIKQYNFKNEGRITVDYIDQSKKELVDKYGSKLIEYDIILDDGTHNIYDQQITFASFFKSLKSGGIFVIEDLHSSIEVKIPEKANLWGWGDPTKITALEMLENFKNTGKIISDYLSEEEKLYLEENIKSIEIFYIAPTSITSIIVKK